MSFETPPVSPDYHQYETPIDADPRELGVQLSDLTDTKITEAASHGLVRQSRDDSFSVLSLARMSPDGELRGGYAHVVRDKPEAEGEAATYTITRYGPTANGTDHRVQDKVIIKSGELPLMEKMRGGSLVRRPVGPWVLGQYLEAVDNGRPFDYDKQLIVKGRIVSRRSLRGMGAALRGYVKNAFDE